MSSMRCAGSWARVRQEPAVSRWRTLFSMARPVETGRHSDHRAGSLDNADGSGAGGQYAQYSQISVKRQVSRDGQSLYYLNGVRRYGAATSPTFLGMVWVRAAIRSSKAGMISRLDRGARPEGSAGLSGRGGRNLEVQGASPRDRKPQYTRENLERLDDLREEVQQLRHLERQSATAQKYKALGAKRNRRVRAELLVLVAGRDADGHRTARPHHRRAGKPPLQAAIAEQRKHRGGDRAAVCATPRPTTPSTRSRAVSTRLARKSRGRGTDPVRAGGATPAGVGLVQACQALAQPQR